MILSVGVRNPTEIEANATEARIRDACLEEARAGFAGFSGEFESFDVVKQGTDTKVSRLDGNQSLGKLDFPNLLARRDPQDGKNRDGGYAVIIGGVVDRRENSRIMAVGFRTRCCAHDGGDACPGERLLFIRWAYEIGRLSHRCSWVT